MNPFERTVLAMRKAQIKAEKEIVNALPYERIQLVVRCKEIEKDVDHYLFRIQGESNIEDDNLSAHNPNQLRIDGE